MTPPEPLDVVAARAKERVAEWRASRGPPPERDTVEWTAQGAVSPLVPREPEPPQRYAPVSLATAPWVTWEETQAAEAALEPWADIGERLAASATLTRRIPRGSAAPRATTEPTVPDLDGAADGARRARLARARSIVRAAGELPALLAGEPDTVIEAARKAILRAADLSSRP